MKAKVSILFFSALFLFNFNYLQAQQMCGLQNYDHIGCEHGLQADPEDKFTFIPPPADFVPGADRSVTINVTYSGGFPAAAIVAFDYAVDIWAANLTSSVAISIDATWASLSGGTLGFAGANNYYQNFGGSVPNTYYPVALANKLAGSDLNTGNDDVSCTFNSNFNWYFGTDGNTPGGQYDFVSVVLHELGHGLGCIGSGDVSGGNGFIGLGGNPVIYDTFIETNTGTDITDFGNGSTALGDALTGDQLYWNGPEGMAGSNGTMPRIYAPSTWNGGSSYSHLREGTYPSGNINSLMTPFLGSAEAIHTPGPIMYGMFEDMGWDVGGCEITSITAGFQNPCNPVNNTYSQQITVEYQGEPSTGQINIGGTSYPISGSPQTLFLVGLPSDGQSVDLTVFFSTDTDCSLTVPNLFTAPEPCCADLHLTEVNTTNDEITITNYGTCDVDISNYNLCSDFAYGDVGSQPLIAGSLVLSSGASTTISWSGLNTNAAGGDLALYYPGGAFNDPNEMVDFVQWTSSGNGRESEADAAGLWTAGTFVSDFSPFIYIGDGSANGVSEWMGSAAPCSISNISAGMQSFCDPMTNTYSQDITFEYLSDPGSGMVTVNGQDFPITGSPQTVTLIGLPSNGMSVDVTISFTDEPSCTASATDVFTAVSSCECPTDFNGDNVTNVQDFLIFLEQFGCSSGCTADPNFDGIVDAQDLLVILSAFGTGC